MSILDHRQQDPRATPCGREAGELDAIGPVSSRTLLSRFVEDHLQSFLALVKRVLSEEDRDAVHDVRVSSRLLQQCLDGMYPTVRPRPVRELRRTLGRVRHALGEWRNCNVILELRYLIEVVVECGESVGRPLLAWLKEIQDVVGRWHDRQVLYALTGDAADQRKKAGAKRSAADAALHEMGKARRRYARLLDELFRVAWRPEGSVLLREWLGERVPNGSGRP